MSDDTRDMLRDQMERARDRMSEELEMYRTAPDTWDDDDDEWWERHAEILADLGVDRDDSPSAVRDAIVESLDSVLEIEYEKGAPFCVTVACGGPNIYLVDMGGFGGSQMRGYWGFDQVTLTGPSITELLDYFRDQAEELDY